MSDKTPRKISLADNRVGKGVRPLSDAGPKPRPIPPAEAAARKRLDELIAVLIDAPGGGKGLDDRVSQACGLDGSRPFTTDIKCANQAAPAGTTITMVWRSPNEPAGPAYLAIAGHPALQNPIEWWHADPCCAFVITGLMAARSLNMIPDGLFDA